MEETATPDTVSMQAAPKKSVRKSPRPASVPRAWIPRPAVVAIAFVLILAIGWGAFHFFGRQSLSDDEAELADLEAFGQEAPSLGEPESPTRSHSTTSLSRDFTPRASGANARPWQTAPAPGSSDLPALFASRDNPLARFEQSPSESGENPQPTSGAWLMGTIEDDDAPQRIALPPQVTPAAADGPLFR